MKTTITICGMIDSRDRSVPDGQIRQFLDGLQALEQTGRFKLPTHWSSIMFRHILMTFLTVVTAASTIAVQGGQVAFAETAGTQSTSEVTPQSCSSGVVLIGADGKPVCG